MVKKRGTYIENDHDHVSLMILIIMMINNDVYPTDDGVFYFVFSCTIVRHVDILR